MDTIEGKTANDAIRPMDESQLPSVEPSPTITPARQLTPQQAAEPCPTCGIAHAAAAPPSYIYAIGEVDWRFPSESLDMEFKQVISMMEKGGLTELQAQKKVMTENRYLARQACWVLKVEGLETYLLQPRDPADFALLVDAFRPDTSRDDVDVVIGVRGPIAPPEACGGLTLPVVFFDQVYSFDQPSLIKAIKKPDGVTAKAFEGIAGALFDRIQQMNDNHGATDEHRAVNYLAVRYEQIYATASDMQNNDYWLTSVDVQHSRLSGSRGRKVVDVVFSFGHSTHRVTKKKFVRVDVSGEYPFVVTDMQDYFDRS